MNILNNWQGGNVTWRDYQFERQKKEEQIFMESGQSRQALISNSNSSMMKSNESISY